MATQTELESKTRNRIKEPKQYKVVMYNDDFTPMDFVVDILEGIFNKDHAEAITLMLRVHKENSAVVGIYYYDIAMTKTQEAMHLAKQKGYPFQVKVEP